MRRLGKYELGARIAAGGMAEIFHATLRGADGFEKEVCIKLIQPQLSGDPEFRRMFSNEALISGRLTHQNIVQVFDYDRDGDLYFIAMEYVFGKDLRAVLAKAFREGAPVPVTLAARICMEAARGLSAAHRLQSADGASTPVVHRDISPHNVMLSFAGEVKITDFGIARLRATSPKTRTGVLKGKFGYMSPEQAGGREVDVRSDVFSLGIILWEMLCRRRLFTGADDMDVLSKVRRAEVAAPSTLSPAIPAELDSITLKALSREPSARYLDAGAMGEALERFIRSWPHDIADESVESLMAKLFPGERRPQAASGTEVMPELLSEPLEDVITGLSAPADGGEATAEAKPAPTRLLETRSPRSRVVYGILAAVIAASALLLVYGLKRSSGPEKTPDSAFKQGTIARQISDSRETATEVSPKGQGLCSPAGGALPCDTVREPETKKPEPDPAQAPSSPPVQAMPGFLTINAEPWANVKIRGKEIGQTPITKKRVPPGEHTVTLQNPELGLTREMKVTVRQGEEVKLSVDMKSR